MALSITPVELNGMVGRTQDFSSMKSADDAKTGINQANFQAVIDQNTQKRANSVKHKDDSSKPDGEADARSGSRNAYSGDGGRNRKGNNKDRVVVKGTRGFDISV